jgi:chitin synthase
MEEDIQVAGCCGEIALLEPSVLNPVVASQHFEYKLSHVMDKAMESAFGFISVLPGAFSMYRYTAIQEMDGTGPLVAYFKAITTPLNILGPFSANMYLAEDRILCFELLARADCNWVLRYVKGAVAVTDVPMTLVDLMKQRRRWLNGSFFAMLYACINFPRVLSSTRHSAFRKAALSIQFFYFGINIFVNWLLLAFLLLGVYYGSSELFGKYLTCDSAYSHTHVWYCNHTLATNCTIFVYVILLLLLLICGLSTKPHQVPRV